MTKNFSDEQIYRYARHIILPEVGGEGQKKLLDAKVLLIGAGGLGSPVLQYLVAAGVGSIGIVDFDKVEMSNLQRQVIHNSDTVGRLKVDSAESFARKLNPDCAINKHNLRLDSSNAGKIIADYDLIVDGTDNFPTRYLLNDFAVWLQKPIVHGSIFRFEGQVTLFVGADGEAPCYRCLYPEPPPPGMTPSCQEGGVLGVLPGVVGSLQALEAIKLILGIGETLAGRLLLYNALTVEFRRLKISKNPNCPLCGTSPTITEPIDYELFCSAQPRNL